MSELQTDFRTRQGSMGSASTLAPLPPAALVRRRRFVRFAAFLTFVVGLGLSAVPRPKEATPTVEVVKDNGVSAEVRTFSYGRWYGVPFAVARVEYDDAGTVKNFTMNDVGMFGVLGNLLVGLGLAFGGAALVRRLRRDG